MNTYQTRGAENRKPTPKYALFQAKTKKEVQDQQVLKSAEPNGEDQYILKLCKQQSKK